MPQKIAFNLFIYGSRKVLRKVRLLRGGGGGGGGGDDSKPVGDYVKMGSG